MLDPLTQDLVARQLPADAYHHLIRTLRLTLPPPLTDTPEDLLRRDHAAIAGIAGLAPANAAEADVAAQYVAAAEQWKDCLRLAQEPPTSRQWAMKCRAQAATMMRQANSALRLLLQMQAARRKLEANSEAANGLAWTEHTATRLMAEALATIPHPEPPPKAEAEKAAPPLAPKERSTPPLPPGEGRGEGNPALDPDLVAAAERYAGLYPERAAQMRRTGKLPCDVRYFDPPEAALAGALIAGRTPALTALDNAPLPEARTG